MPRFNGAYLDVFPNRGANGANAATCGPVPSGA